MKSYKKQWLYCVVFIFPFLYAPSENSTTPSSAQSVSLHPLPTTMLPPTLDIKRPESITDFLSHYPHFTEQLFEVFKNTVNALDNPHQQPLPEIVAQQIQNTIINTMFFQTATQMMNSIFHNQTVEREEMKQIRDTILQEGQRLYSTIQNTNQGIDSRFMQEHEDRIRDISTERESRVREIDTLRSELQSLISNVGALSSSLTQHVATFETFQHSVDQRFQEKPTPSSFPLLEAFHSFFFPRIFNKELFEKGYHLIFWKKETLDNMLLTYLFFITTIVPHCLQCIPYSPHFFSIVSAYWYLLAPLWKPVTFFTQLNVAYRLFWGGYSYFCNGEELLSQKNKQFFIISGGVALALIASFYFFKKRYVKIYQPLLDAAYEKMEYYKAKILNEEYLEYNDDDELAENYPQ